ncbi:MAG: hypothetical protein AVDCRST_MAG87-1714, partial [uncultured Thermomicrobiales bacterium]
CLGFWSGSERRCAIAIPPEQKPNVLPIDRRLVEEPLPPGYRTMRPESHATTSCIDYAVIVRDNLDLRIRSGTCRDDISSHGPAGSTSEPPSHSPCRRT